MKVFVGWSGTTSHKVALALRDWLPSVIQYVKPWVSSEDIAKGGRWSSDLAKELERSKFGVICVTKDNWSSPWINFEAGALSKEIERAGVSPLLFDVKPSEIQGPLTQFQYVVGEKEDIFKLLKSINEREITEQRLEETVLRKAFERWWPDLNEAFEKIEKGKPTKIPLDTKPDPEAMLEELLDTTRAMQRETWSFQNRDKAEREAFFSELKMRLDQLYAAVDRRLGALQADLNPIRDRQSPEFEASGEDISMEDVVGGSRRGRASRRKQPGH
jgi:TIR domain-containing protein